MTKLGIRTFLIICFILIGSSRRVLAQHSGDGVCKGTPTPNGFAVTGEMMSPECPISSAIQKNAWIITALADGLRACHLPDYETEPAENLRYVRCGRTEVASCPKLPDGTPNGVVLRTMRNCSLYDVRCLQNGKIDFFDLTLDDLHDDRCGIGRDINAFHAFYLKPGHTYPACARSAASRVLMGANLPNGTDPYAGELVANVSVDAALVIRRYFNPDCGKPDEFGLNAVVMKRVLVHKGENVDLFVCYERGWLGAPDITSIFHDDRCGTQNEANAFIWQFRAEQQ